MKKVMSESGVDADLGVAGTNRRWMMLAWKWLRPDICFGVALLCTQAV
jgi:hypothetical protein